MSHVLRVIDGGHFGVRSDLVHLHDVLTLGLARTRGQKERDAFQVANVLRLVVQSHAEPSDRSATDRTRVKLPHVPRHFPERVLLQVLNAFTNQVLSSHSHSSLNGRPFSRISRLALTPSPVASPSPCTSGSTRPAQRKS